MNTKAKGGGERLPIAGRTLAGYADDYIGCIDLTVQVFLDLVAQRARRGAEHRSGPRLALAVSNGARICQVSARQSCVREFRAF
jgi:hypothetical protein